MTDLSINITGNWLRLGNIICHMLLVLLPCSVNEWITCDFTPFLNSISVISGLLEGDNERLSAMKILRLERFPSPAGLVSGTARSAGKRLTEPTGLLTVFESGLEGECLLQ